MKKAALLNFCAEWDTQGDCPPEVRAYAINGLFCLNIRKGSMRGQAQVKN